MKPIGIALIAAAAVAMLWVAGCGDESPVSAALEKGAEAPAAKLTVSRGLAGGYRRGMVVDCEFEYGSTSMAEDWTDEGIRHLRGIVYELNSVPESGNLEVKLAGVCNHNIILATGAGDFWGQDTTEVTWKGLTGTFQGSHRGTREAFYTGYSTHVYYGIDGDFAGWTLWLNGTWNMDPEVKAGTLKGVIRRPYGR